MSPEDVVLLIALVFGFVVLTSIVPLLMPTRIDRRRALAAMREDELDGFGVAIIEIEPIAQFR